MLRYTFIVWLVFTVVGQRVSVEELMKMIMMIIIIIIIYCNWVVTRWQWLFYMYTKYEIGYC